MTCGEAEELLGAFVDGELPGAAMRETARHLARCDSCEALAVQLERVKEVVREAVVAEVEEPDTRAAWEAITERLGTPQPRLRERFISLRARLRFGRLPAPLWIGSAVAAAVVAAMLWTGGGRPPGDQGEGIQLLAQRSRIDLLEVPGNVRVWNQQGSGALVIWVEDHGIQGVNLE